LGGDLGTTYLDVKLIENPWFLGDGHIVKRNGQATDI
jgi:hypothetical protein